MDKESGSTNYQNNWLDDLDKELIFRLNKSLEQADKGEFISHDDMKVKYAVWLNL